MFNFTGRQMDVQGRNIKERSTIYTKLEGVRSYKIEIQTDF